MVVRKPIDYVLTVAYVHEGIACSAAFKVSRPRLLGGILIRAQVPVGRILRASFFAWSGRRFEAIRPQRFLVEVNRRHIDGGFAGFRRRLGSRDRLWTDRSMDI